MTLKITNPKIPSELDSIDLKEKLQYEQHFNMCIIRDCEINGETIEKLCFENVVFKNVTFYDVSFRFLELTDVMFEKCDLSNVDFSDAIVHRVHMKDCKMVGMNLAGSALRNISLDGCIGNMAAFGYSDCKNVQFRNSSLCNSDFFESKFKNVVFEQCDINGANLSGTVLKGIDLSSCTFEKLVVSIENLEGCIITSDQAVGFAKALGLVTNDETF
ncbi:pentapeptide repeat-containing protein [Alkalihalobacillus sp. AL-G]|uniref:pentapeptide repeat-containing protein n=1 Tax=Alkalihalobacillus sp. AL-G TaxID=2926399 RepID=UPI00272A77D6|nr:pentapeptide repeat-containing protein [Alkalihalobacillus sp. AL-G]WLD94599.1 pentapeptide repeat-containing protein [Alkalihalobacillus sp. AL-G]